MKVLGVPLPDAAIESLRRLGEREFRSPHRQAAVLLMDGLQRAGFSTNRPDVPPEKAPK